MGKLELNVPRDTYSTLRVELDNGRVMHVVLPAGLSANEAAQIVDALDGIQNIVAGWQLPDQADGVNVVGGG